MNGCCPRWVMPGCQQDTNFRIALADPLRELITIHRARHGDVAEHQLDLVIGAQQLDCLLGVDRLDHDEPCIAQMRAHGHAQDDLVLDDQNHALCSLCRPRRHRLTFPTHDFLYATDDTTSGTSLGGLIPSRQNAGDSHCALFVLRFKFFGHRNLRADCRVVAANGTHRFRGHTAAAPKLPTVLLVESSALMRMALAAYLRECGYAVIEADNPAEARQLLEAGTETDVAFIDLEGHRPDRRLRVAHWIRKARPDLKVLLTSGVRRAAQTAGDLCEEGPHLAKPYEHRDLEAQIRRLLAR